MIARNPLPIPPDRACHGSRAVEAFRTATTLIEQPFRSSDEDAALLSAAWACHEHWILADGGAPLGRLTATLLLARAHLVVGRLQPALLLARRAWRLATKRCLGAEATAEALVLLITATSRLGRPTEAEHWQHLAAVVLPQVTSPTARWHLESVLRPL